MMTIKLTINLEDDFKEFDCFDKDENDWKVIKIGDYDHEYEPGYISEKNYAEIKFEMDEDCVIVLKKFIIERLPGLVDFLSTIKDHDRIASKWLVLYLEFKPENLGLLFHMSGPEMMELSKYDIDISIFPIMDWYLDASDPSGRIFAKYENEIN